MSQPFDLSIRRLILFAMLAAPAAAAQAQNPPPAQAAPEFPSETPAKFAATYDGWDYGRRAVDIPMRDGVKLHTVILVPRGARKAPMLLTRTPYNAEKLTSRNESTHLKMALDGYDNAARGGRGRGAARGGGPRRGRGRVDRRHRRLRDPRRGRR
jgi:predicted acyl esterase